MDQGSDNIEDYYLDPVEMGYGDFVDWNRSFRGSDALKERAANQHRTKVTLEWNDDDVAAAMAASLFDHEHPARYMALPNLMYGTFQVDAVRSQGETVGVSQWAAYTAKSGHVLSSAVIPLELATPGTELTLLWGEPDSPRQIVDRNELREIRVKVAPLPYFDKRIKTGQQ